MCGIVGYVGNRPVLPLLLKGLQRLEYRGYDSTGVAYFNGKTIDIQKSEGKLKNVESLFDPATRANAEFKCGIGHTRWATHGKPTTQNAHPHRTGHVVLVHNGIIENYQEIRSELIKRGHRPASETDSELFGFLVLEKMDDQKMSFFEAVRTSFLELHGNCSVVVMSEKEPGTIIGVRNGSPLVVAKDPTGGVLFASDAQPILEYAKEVTFLENGDMAVGTNTGVVFKDIHSGKEVMRPTTKLDWSPEMMEKQGYAHFMLKEIHEQPMALVDTLNSILDRARVDPFPMAIQPGIELLSRAKRMTIIACGSSWHAGMVAKYWLERWARISVTVEFASEFRYRDPVLSPDEFIVGITQSGETADTLSVLREMRQRGFPTLGITNVRNSSVAREAQACIYTSAGPEIGVAATKSFITQMLSLLLMAGYLGLKSSTDRFKELDSLFHEIVKLPHVLETFLGVESAMPKQVKKVAAALKDIDAYFFMGRGLSYPLAMEAALKLKEIAYVHAEGYAAGELKHGPIAMIDERMAVVVLAPHDGWREKTVSNLEEVKARGGIIIGVGVDSDKNTRNLCHHWISLPEGIHEALSPFTVAPVIQLLSYEIALLRGTDIDKPRNLAKSVTVE